MSKDYYKILGVEKGASDEEIKKAYRKMALKHHPDRNNGDKASEESFKEATNAYEVLSDPQKKQQFDTYGSEGPDQFSGGFRQQGTGFNMDDIFSQFGDIFGRQQNRGGQRKGSDLRIRISMDLKDVLSGVTKNLKYKRHDKCKPCQGKGGTDVKECMACHGSGQRHIIQSSPFGQIRQVISCNNCAGTGKVIHNKCKSCHGEGIFTTEQNIEVEVPRGVQDGTVLTMTQMGNHVRDGIPGDLQIIIEEIPDPIYRRDGKNLITEKTISTIDAILGAEYDMDAPTGKIFYKVDPGTQYGKVIRVGGKGVPDIHFGLGDLYIKLNIKIPNSLSKEEKDILTSLKGSKNFNV